MRVLSAAGVALLAWFSVGAAAGASPDDVARYLSGLGPADQAAWQALTQTSDWQEHAKELNARWVTFERTQLSRVRRFASGEPFFHRRVAYYMFGGPDFAYVTSFFPDANIYVLSGLEPVTDPPEPLQMSPQQNARDLARLRRSLKTFFDYGFFITKEMHAEFSGIVPVLYAMLARSGKWLKTVDLVHLTEDGTLVAAPARDAATSGVRMTFTDADRGTKELLYFNVDLSNRGVDHSGFLQFCGRLPPGDSLLKNASYLLHRGEFSQTRAFLLAHSAAIVQDDSGLPLRYFNNAEWRVRVFGHYRRPSGPFEDFYQPDLDALTHERHLKPVDFAMGYFWWIDGAGLQIAVKKGMRIRASPVPH